jgi:transposase
MAYDRKYREKVMNFIDKGNSMQKAHEVFEVGTTTIKEWKKLRKETGELTKRPVKAKFQKICPDKLKAYIRENPDSYLSEIAEKFRCTATAISKALKRMKITRKKNG